MPFGFGRKEVEAPPPQAETPAVSSMTARAIGFKGFTAEWRLEGQLVMTGRLLDVVNQREAIPVADVRWAPLDGSADLASAPGIQEIDPYDLIVVIAGSDTLAARSDDERAAHRVHKVSFDVALIAPPFTIIGSVQIHPGAVPESLMDRGAQMFVAITDPVVRNGEAAVDIGSAEAVLVNRFYLNDVIQVDKA
ncbi:MAG: hypothetical protein EPO00_10535, partial [Chloroflexota bacterium]